MLGLLERVIVNQMKGKVSQTSTEDTMSLVNEIVEPANPRNYSQAKQMVKKTCLKNARQIHACINDCIVYYDSPFLPEYQYSKLEKCPRCDARRYYARTKIPRKIFEFIPLRDHVDALFCRPDVIARYVRCNIGVCGWCTYVCDCQVCTLQY